MLIKATKKQISDLREDKNFYELYEQSLIIAQNENVSTLSNNDVFQIGCFKAQVE